MPLKLKIVKTIFGGDGLAELNGKAVFVEGALPGETVEAEVTEEKKSFSRAKILRVLDPSPYRVEPPCTYASSALRENRRCGGCQYQHVSYEEELRIKQSQVEEIFQRAGIQTPIRPIVRSEREWGYRSSLTLHPVTPDAKSTRLGLFARDNKTVLAVKNCLLADSHFAPIFLKELPAKKCSERVTFKLDEASRIFDDLKENFLRMRLGPHSYLVHSSGFFQTHPGVAEQIAKKVAEKISEFKPDVLFDLFAGVGTFGLAAAPLCGSVVFIEENRQAVQALRMNLADWKTPNAQVIAGRVEKQFDQAWAVRAPGRAMVLLDPPRAGLDPKLARALSESEAGEILYVSCDPATLARDLRILQQGGRWTVQEAIPYDMFPKTKHLEMLAILRRG